jgi:hypothetical protein
MEYIDQNGGRLGPVKLAQLRGLIWGPYGSNR